MGKVERLSVEEPRTANSALTWLAWHPARGVAVKTATVFPGNSSSGSGPNIQSVVTLFDAACGRPLAAIHGESFTRMRTFLRAVRPSLRRVLIWNRTAERGERLAADLRQEGIDATALLDPEAAVCEADIVSCLTASADPVLHGAWLKAGAHVDLVGGFTPAMRESDDEVVRRARLFADTLRFTLTTCGDYATPIAQGVIAPDAVEGDLFNLCAGKVAGRRSAEEITVFKNGGGGHLDLTVARTMWDLCVATS